MTYDVDDMVRLTVAFKDAGGVPQDPTTVELRVRGGGVTTTYSDAVKDSVGTYHRDVILTKPGPHAYRWIGTGVVQAAEEGAFTVRVPGA